MGLKRVTLPGIPHGIRFSQPFSARSAGTGSETMVYCWLRRGEVRGIRQEVRGRIRGTIGKRQLCESRVQV